jgi:hypothetical protein
MISWGELMDMSVRDRNIVVERLSELRQMEVDAFRGKGRSRGRA